MVAWPVAGVTKEGSLTLDQNSKVEAEVIVVA